MNALVDNFDIYLLIHYKDYRDLLRERCLTLFMPFCGKKIYALWLRREFVYFTLELRMTKAKSWFIAANADLQEKKGISIFSCHLGEPTISLDDKAKGTMEEVHQQIRGEQYITKGKICIEGEKL